MAEVERGDHALDAVRARHVDVALLDIEMPASTDLRRRPDRPRAAPDPDADPDHLRPAGYPRRAIESGAGGFLLKDALASELADAIREVNAGRRVIDPGLAAAAIADGVSPLTEREHDVLAAATKHATAGELAAHMHLSEGTVRNYLSAAIRKLGARNRAEAIRIAEEKGWLPLNSSA